MTLRFHICEIHMENRLHLFSTDIMGEKNKQSLFFSPEIHMRVINYFLIDFINSNLILFGFAEI